MPRKFDGVTKAFSKKDVERKITKLKAKPNSFSNFKIVSRETVVKLKFKLKIETLLIFTIEIQTSCPLFPQRNYRKP